MKLSNIVNILKQVTMYGAVLVALVESLNFLSSKLEGIEGKKDDK